MAKTRYEKAWEILGSALSDQSASVYQAQREREEEELRRQQKAEEEQLRRDELERLRSEELLRAEGRARAPRLDQLGTIEGMQQALNKPAAPTAEPGISSDFGAIRSSVVGGNELNDASKIVDELGYLQTKYQTPEQRAEARARLQKERDLGLMDRSTFGQASAAARELNNIDKAEKLFSDPSRVEAMKEEAARLKASGNINSQSAEQYFKDTDSYGSRTVADVVNSRTSFIPIATGLVGAGLAGAPGAFAFAAAGSIPTADQARRLAYMEGKDAGMPEDLAREFSHTMAASEFVLSTLGEGGAAALSGILKTEAKKRIVDDLAKHVLKTSVKQAGLGYTEEAGTQALQMGIRADYAKDSDLSQATKDYLRQTANIRQDGTIDWGSALSEMNRAGLAGLATTAAAATPVEIITTSAEMGRQAKILDDQVKGRIDARTVRNEFRAAQERNLASNNVEQGELFDLAPDNTPSFEEQAASRQREHEIDAGIQLGRRQSEQDQQAANRETNREELAAPLQRKAEEIRGQLEQVDGLLAEGNYSQGTLNSRTALQQELAQVESQISSIVDIVPPQAPRLRNTTVPYRMVPELPNREPTQQTLPFPRVPDQPKQATQTAPTQQVTADHFNNPDTNYRVVHGDAAFDDLVESGVVRTNHGSKPKTEAGVSLGARPTRFPSFKRGSAAMDYANGDPNHYIIETADPSVQPSKEGRHGKGSTMFPYDANGRAMDSLDGKNVRVYKHVGNGKYELVYENGAKVGAKAAQGPTPTTATAEEATVPVSTITEALQNAPAARTALPSTGTTNPNPSTLEDVRSALQSEGRSSTTSRLSYMLQDGNLDIVQDQSEIPGDIGGMQEQGKGWYDPKTGKLYLVTSNLDKNNIKGDILATLAHETKHGADFGGSAKLAGSFVNFVGSEANERMVAQIKQAAAKGNDPSAVKAMAIIQNAYEGQGYSGDQMSSEIVAAYISQEAQKSGTKTSLYRGIVSPIRQGARQLIGSKNISLGDIHYVADQLVGQVAQRGERLEPSSGIALPMTISGGVSAPLQLQNNRTWLSADGKRKYEISDAPSRVALLKGFQLNTDYPANEVLYHPELYADIPEAEHVKVRFTDLGDKVGGYYTVEGNQADGVGPDTIVVNSRYIQTDKANIGDVAPRGGNLHKVIIHEMQHAVQKISHTTNGASPEDFLSKEGKQLAQQIADADAAINYSQQVLGLQDPDLEALRTDLQTKYDKEYDAATEKYFRVLGELESYRAQDSLLLTQKELDETGLGQQEKQWAKENGGITTERGKKISRALPSLVDNSVPPRDLRTLREKAKDKSAIFRVLNSLVSTTDNLGMGLFRLQDARQGLRGDLSLRAEKLGHRMENGVTEVAKARKTTIDKVYKELEAMLASINKEPDSDVRQSMVKDLDKDFPGVGTAINEIRELKWALARNLLEQRAAQGTDLTAKESNIYAAIVRNAETYTTRAYTGTQIPSKRIAKQRLSNIEKDPTGESATKYNEAISYLVDNHLLIPSKDTMLDMKRGAVARIYENYKGDASGKSVETMANELDLIPRANKEALQQQAVAIAEELMGLKSSKTTIARGYRGQRQNRTILEGREDVPDPIRFLMGEITNPVAAELMTVARLINLYSQTKLLQSIKDQGADRWYKNYKDGDFNRQLTSEEYGPLKGMYVTPSVAQFLEPAVSIGLDLEQSFNSPSGKLAEWAGIVLDKTANGARTLTGAVKMADLVTSPAAMVWNYLGAYGIALQNGVVNPVSLAKAQYLTMHAINAHYNNDNTLTKRLSKEEQTAIQEIIRARVLDSATVGEFQQSMYQGIFKILQEVEGGDVSILSKTKELMSGGASVARDMYAFMDMWAKVAAFRDRKDMLTKFYKAKDPTVTAEAIIREAGETINSTNISYTRAFGLVKKLERNVPMLTMYLTYFSEVPRSVVISYAQSIKAIRRGHAETNTQASLLCI